ncbi:E3 ubiquitin ligase BIG BROTHER-related-like isoform X1 [Typha angustifolia]|uniref:E3 ubiquitin ligase BIG BROTHER-related-like isoform X1 n=1 Tax=Typha angustifolia TaxID=59011 RepID=UPI003C2F3EB4
MAIRSGERGKQQNGMHYVNSSTPNVVVESFEGLDLYFDDLALGEVLQDQEIVHQSLMGNSHSGDHRSNRDNGQSSNGVNSSRAAPPTWCASDEALARQLQELENMHIDTSPNDFLHIASVESSQPVSESNSTNNYSEVTEEDNIEPDNMTYEQLQSLGEEIGTESRGLSDEIISYLHTSKYNPDFSSGEENHEECVICLSAFRKGEKLINLPCEHYYHAACITRWFKDKKTCPVCKYEVFGPS